MPGQSSRGAHESHAGFRQRMNALEVRLRRPTAPRRSARKKPFGSQFRCEHLESALVRLQSHLVFVTGYQAGTPARPAQGPLGTGIHHVRGRIKVKAIFVMDGSVSTISASDPGGNRVGRLGGSAAILCTRAFTSGGTQGAGARWVLTWSPLISRIKLTSALPTNQFSEKLRVRKLK